MFQFIMKQQAFLGKLAGLQWGRLNKLTAELGFALHDVLFATFGASGQVATAAFCPFRRSL